MGTVITLLISLYKVSRVTDRVSFVNYLPPIVSNNKNNNYCSIR